MAVAGDSPTSEYPTSVPDGQSSLTNLITARDLNRKLDWLKSARLPLDNQWKLNIAFYKGRQYSYYNKAARRLESLPVEDGEKPRYRVRMVNNQIVTGAQSLLSKLTKTKPNLYAEPGSGADQDIKASQVANQLMEFWWTDLRLDDRLEEALLWGIIGGQGYWKITWDAQAGKPMRFTLGPDGKPITDDSLKDLFRTNLQQAGVEPQEKVVYLGDIRVEAMSPFDVYLDPSAKVFDDCTYAICIHHLSRDEVKARWKVEIEPDSITTLPDTSLPLSGAADAKLPDSVRVAIGYFKPTPTLPNGRYVVFTKYKILEDSKWPYPFNELPLVKFPGIRIPGEIYDSSVVEHAIPLQKDLNRTLSQIIEYKNLTVKPRVWAPTGSITTRLTSEPGALYEYNPIGDHKPEVEQLPALPPYIFEHLTNINAALKDAFSLTEVTQGTVPPNVEAGVAIDLLQEMATDRLEPTIKLIEASLAQGGQLMLSLAQEYYIEPRIVKINGANQGSTTVKRFSQADIDSGITIRATVGSGLPRTRAGKQALILDLVQKQIIPPDKAIKHLDLGDYNGLAAQMRADEDQALRENDKMVEGQIVNDAAWQNAIKQLETGGGIDPLTGKPIQDIQQFLMNAALQPQPFENYQTHLDTHSLFMKGVEFEGLPIPIKQAFLLHYSQTLQTFLSLPKPVEFKAVNPTLRIQATAGPTAVAEILNKAGLYDLQPQTLTEPPLDTWVTDDATKPSENNTGNTHVQDTIAAQQAIQQSGEQQQMQQAQLQANQQGQQQDAETHQVNTQASVALHAQKIRKASADADASEMKAQLAARVATEKKVNPTPTKPKGK